MQVRQLATTHRELARRLDELEQKTEALAMSQENLGRNTRNQLKQVFDAIRDLMTPPVPPKRAIGFGQAPRIAAPITASRALTPLPKHLLSDLSPSAVPLNDLPSEHGSP